MDAKGRIHELISEQRENELREELAKSGEGPLIPIPAKDVARLKVASVQKRLDWYAKQRAYNFSADKAEKNAAKAQRRKRRGK